MNKMEMYETLKKYMYAIELKDLKIFSKQYLSILQEKYSDNETSQPYSIISIDFNKMNDINNLYGMERGDKVIHDVLEIIMGSEKVKGVLSDKAKCVRTGGDEFLILLTEENKNHIEDIYKALEKEKDKVLGCTVTATSIYSKYFKNLKQMMKRADENINIKKKIKRQNSKKGETWENVEYHLEGGFNTLFKSLRLHKDYLNIEELKYIYHYFLTATAEQMQENDGVQEPTIENEKVSEKEKEKAISIDEIVTNQKPTKEEIEKIDSKDYDKYINKMVREENTGKMSKAYMYQYLLEEEKREFEALYITMGQIKLSNSKSNYESTNQMIKEIIKELREYIIETSKKFQQQIEFPNRIFTKETKNMLIDLGGGDFLLLIDPEMSAKEIFENIKQYVQEKRELGDNETLLKLVASEKSIKVNKDNIKEAIEEMKETTLDEKDRNIHALLKEEEIMVPIMKSIFKEAFSDYATKVEDANTIEGQQRYIRIMAEKGINEIAKFNDSQQKFIKAKDKKTIKREEDVR